MTDNLTEAFPAGETRPVDTSRRNFFGGASRLATFGGLAAIAACSASEESPLANVPTPTPSGSPAPTPTPTATPSIVALTDTDMLVLLLQFQYVQAEYYSRGVFGLPLSSALVSGTGTAGPVTGARQVTFADPALGDMMREIAVEKIDQVVRLRAALGGATPARPAVNLGVDETGVFTKYGRDANDVSTAAGRMYDVYASQERFLLGAFILEDPVVAAWRGVAGLLTTSANVDIALGLLASSACHAGLIRSQIFLRGAVTGSTLFASTTRLSDLRDGYAPEEDDQGVGGGSGTSFFSTITPTDGDGEVYGRLPQMSINVFFMTRVAATSGGFFPAGLNGNLRTSVGN